MQKKFPTYIYVAVAAVFLFQIASLFFLGVDLQFTYGLVLGTAISFGNYWILQRVSGFALDRGRGAVGILILGYALRLLIYGMAFLYAFQLGTSAGIATLLGFLTIKLGLIWAYGRPSKQEE